jgi:hypothetical protein
MQDLKAKAVAMGVVAAITFSRVKYEHGQPSHKTALAPGGGAWHPFCVERIPEGRK